MWIPDRDTDETLRCLVEKYEGLENAGAEGVRLDELYMQIRQRETEITEERIREEGTVDNTFTLGLEGR